MEKYDKNTTEASTLKPDYYSVRFKRDRVDYFIDRNHLELAERDWVLVQAERGRDIGQIKSRVPEKAMGLSQRKYPLEILHKAKPEEVEQLAANRYREEEAMTTCQQFIDFRGLDMKLVDVEMQFDGNKITFYFTAEHRVDFRELVKDLAATYRTRIELRQIGVRDETRKLGGLGPCGLELCCTKWLKEFSAISTQFARDQNLAVNPVKLSGLCGRLFCCLDYEQKFYEEARRKFPQQDRMFESDGDRVVIEKVDFFKEILVIKHLETDVIEKIPLDEFRNRYCMKNKDWLEKWLPKKQKDE
ncbi:hypothetical protein DRQ36_00680 [bacterium]|nr:MAG: hypothetical protein DRQ36_00680 [bacterium]